MRCFVNKRAGTSLVEVLVSTAIVGMMIVAALETVGAVYRSKSKNAMRQLGPGLAQELMSEVLCWPFTDPEFPDGEINTEDGELPDNRQDFDDVDDYHDWDRTGPVYRDDTPLAGYDDWRRKVEVEWADPETGNTTSSETELKKITVTAMSPDGDITKLVAFRSKEGALEKGDFSSEVTIVCWLGAELQLGNCPYVTHSGSRLVNYATDVN